MSNICHQHDKRLTEMILAGEWEHDPALDYCIEPISKVEAFDFIKKYEYLGTVGRPQARYGAFDNLLGRLAAVALFGKPTLTPQPGVIVLERGACAPFAHVNAASWFLPRVVTRAAQDHGWHTFVAYCDPDAAEVGTVYQAAGWRYVGQSATRTLYGKPRPREYWTKDGVTLGEKGWRKRGHTVAEPDGWVRVLKSPKHKYVWVEGTWNNGRGPSKSEVRRLWAAQPPALPYPSR